MRVLVLGGAGMLGHKLVLGLRAAGHEVACTVRDAASSPLAEGNPAGCDHAPAARRSQARGRVLPGLHAKSNAFCLTPGARQDGTDGAVPTSPPLLPSSAPR